MAVIELKALSKSYGPVVAVKSFDLSTEDGEFIVLVGPSGCGKTTTMRMIAGLETSTSGSIRIDGRDATGLSAADRDVAMVFQNYALYPHLTVFENLAFCLRVRRWSKRQIEDQVTATAKTLGIEALLQRKPATLSGGQRQRVALGRAIVRKPQVFLMDEPLSNLDAGLRVEMRAEIVKLCRRLKVTTFYVTHDQLEALTMGHRVAVMKDGLTQQIATPQELYDRPVNQFVAGFIGSPPMNFLPAVVAPSGALEGVGFSLRPDPRLRAALATGGREVTAGIRPEHLRPAGDDVPGDAGSVEGTIELIEPLGSQVMIQVAVGGRLIMAQFERRPDLAVGKPIRLFQSLGTLHAFRGADGRSVFAS